MKRIVQASAPLKVILFGSTARGGYREGSDLDFLVIKDEFENERKEANKISARLMDIKIPIDIIVASSEQIIKYGDTVGMIYRRALRDGKVMYES
ncbi:MAG: nucleotidyltransferase domain-containing protein [Candidatus Eremiobacteraeota bacterium]|nr:nucleotidyltransferase domain-containing protein [Candidatus Eremiobacteraeota bacterium]